MKHSINIILVAMMIGIYSQSSSAQQQKRFNKNFDKLELSEDQKVALEALQEEKKIAYEALPSDASKEDKMDLRKSFKDKMASILTAEQLAILKENRNRPSKRRGHKAGDEKGENWKGKGNRRSHKKEELTDEQKAKLSEARAILDEEISDEDKLIIEEIREKSKALKASFKDNKETRDKESWRAMKKEMSTIHEPLKGLTKKYKDQIKAVLANVDGVKRKDAKKEGDKANALNRKPKHRKVKKYGHFLLLDASTIHEQGELTQMPRAATLSLSPNPAADRTTIEYTINTAGPVVIDVRNEQGEVIKTLLTETKEIGTYSLDADLDAFQNKSYYITITDKVGTQSKQLIIVK